MSPVEEFIGKALVFIWLGSILLILEYLTRDKGGRRGPPKE
jgi:hypothetical protein